MTQAPARAPVPGASPLPAAPKAAQPTAKPPMVQFHGVTKRYANGDFQLTNLDLEIKQGDFVFVTGPSGAGKSTLMKLIYGEVRPDVGTVVVDGTCVNALRGDRLSLFRRRLGVVFQDYKLIPRRTVAENVAFTLRAQGVPRQEIQRRLLPTLKMVGLQDKGDRFPSELSGGEQQRASIARAIVGAPCVLLADEPTGNLDSDNALQVLTILKKLNSFGITVLVTTHDTQLIYQSKFPVLRLAKGQLQQTPGPGSRS